jgi:hypothetical protein
LYINLVFATLQTVLCQQYNETDSLYYVDFAGASYCAGTLGRGIERWNCAACKKHPDVTKTTVISVSSLSHEFNGFVAYDSATNSIILAIAGTDPLKIKNWIDDLDFLKTNYPLCEEYGTESCEVHEGFYETYMLASDKVRSTVKSYMASFPTAKVHVTGHSLGAIVAVFAALDLKLTQGIDITRVYTYGQPRGGDDAWARFVEGNLEEFRVTHYKDPVPHLPPMELLGEPFFHHTTTEVFYDERDSTGKYVVCAESEDMSCSDQFDTAFLDTSVVDHLFYVGFDFVTNYLTCKL